MKKEPEKRLSTGIAGLDEILTGGLVPGRNYIVRGGPGTGKTTLGLHFLTAGISNKEKVLFISLGEREEQILKNAESMGFNLKGMTFLDLSPDPDFFAKAESYDIFSPAEVEREPTTKKIIDAVEQLKPSRIFIDAMTQFRYLAADAFQFRKQTLSFLRFLIEHQATVLFTSEGSVETPDDDLQFLSDGVIHLDFQKDIRTLRVSKFRGSAFSSGSHTLRLSEKGIEVFPKLLPEIYRKEFTTEVISSGVPELDELMHGGLERGTITIISGPSGSGKTSLGLLFMKEAAGRGERSVVYAFEESLETLLTRCESINIPVHSMIERGTLAVAKIEPLRFSPDEIVNLVRQEVEEKNARIVMIDSSSGYNLSMRGEDLVTHLHALSKYLINMGVTVIIINEVENITGDFRVTEIGISYLADNVVFLRYLEFGGQLRKTIGVLKKRLSDFEKTIREFEITKYGFKVGKPLTELRGILTGRPEWVKPSDREI